MRIIAGTLRGRRLRAPEGRATRPMLDRVREALFGTLTPWLADARVLDLFAGSGSLGLEALSRGAGSVRFVEQHAATARLLRDNAGALGAADRAEIVCGDALAPKSWAAGPYDLIFLDPPYALLKEQRAKDRVLTALARLVRERLAGDGRLVLHAPRGLLRADAFRDLRVDCRQYGSNALWYVAAGDGASRDGP